MNRRIVVTGLGAVTPVGNNVADTWAAIIAGKSGIGLIDTFDTEGFASRIGGMVKNFDLDTYLSAKDARKMDPFIHYGIASAVQAFEDSGYEITDENAERIGVSIGSGIGGLDAIAQNAMILNDRGPRRISPFFISSSLIMAFILELRKIECTSKSHNDCCQLSQL